MSVFGSNGLSFTTVITCLVELVFPLSSVAVKVLISVPTPHRSLMSFVIESTLTIGQPSVAVALPVTFKSYGSS